MEKTPLPAVISGGLGTGKSTLSMVVINDGRVISVFRRNRYFVRLDKASDADQIIDKLASSLGVPFGPNAVDQIADFMREKKCLIVLDNIEQAWWSDTGGVELLLSRIARAF